MYFSLKYQKAQNHFILEISLHKLSLFYTMPPMLDFCHFTEGWLMSHGKKQSTRYLNKLWETVEDMSDFIVY